MLNSPVGGLLNADLIQVLASLRHYDTILIADAGMPCPPTVREIDLSVTPGLPDLPDVLEPVLHLLAVTGAVIATEWLDAGRSIEDLSPSLSRVRVDVVPHEEIKILSARARVLVRTGATTPYANVILTAAVTF